MVENLTIRYFEVDRLMFVSFITSKAEQSSPGQLVYHKINSVNLTIETLTTHNNRNTQPSGIHPKILDAI